MLPAKTIPMKLVKYSNRGPFVSKRSIVSPTSAITSFFSDMAIPAAHNGGTRATAIAIPAKAADTLVRV